jgi:surface protein
MPQFGIFRGFSESSFGNKLFAGQTTADVGSSTQTFVFTVKTDNVGTSTSTQFRLPLTTSTGLDFVIDWGDGVVQRITSHTAPEVTHTYPSIGTYQIQINGLLVGWSFSALGDRLKMLNVFQWGVLNISATGAFDGCTNLTCSATDAPVITATLLTQCFRDCTNFNGAIGNWDVSNVTGMANMFLRATSFNQPIGNWNVGQVTTMSSMLSLSNAFDQDISNWNITSVTNFNNFMNGKTNLNYSAANLDLIYQKWALLAVKPNLTINFGTIKYTAAGAAGRLILTSAPNNWTITDGGI